MEAVGGGKSGGRSGRCQKKVVEGDAREIRAEEVKREREVEAADEMAPTAGDEGDCSTKEQTVDPEEEPSSSSRVVYVGSRGRFVRY